MGEADSPLLEVSGLVKDYPGVRALDGVDLTVTRGQVHCLIGQNGAGKSTLIKCVSGLVERAGEREVKLIIENCVMEGWHPDGYPGNLAYSPELWEWMFSLGLYLNYDPSHLVWMGIDPVTALRPYVDRIPHAQAKDIELFPERRNR